MRSQPIIRLLKSSAPIALTVFGAAMTAASAQQPAAIPQQVAEKRAALLAQCTPLPQVADAAKLPIHVTTWGNAGLPVLMVHGGVQGGIGGGPSNFAGQKLLADEGFQLRLVDRPGFGDSPSRGADDMTADSVWIADTLGNSSHLIGHSYGGAEALLAAARRPQAVRSLILVEPALQAMLLTEPQTLADPGVRAGLQMVAGSILSAKTPADFASGFAARLGSGADGRPNPSAAALQASPKRAEILGCSILQAKTALPAEMRAAANTVLAAHIPVLVISGGYDPGQDAVDEALAKLLGGRHVVVLSPNHFIQQANPTGFNTVVAAFMKGAERR
ncbi:MAG: alpha/beta hydrolase [Bradyrhizobium sp.]|nr:alpha/beta hydrolase [Bradyrhizobium sp.]